MNMNTNTFTRHVAAREMPVPALTRKWARAMSLLNLADDQRYLLEVTVSERRADLLAQSVALVAAPSSEHAAQVARLTRTLSARTLVPAPAADLVLVTASPNGPNTSPLTHLTHAVGLEVAA